MVMNPPAPGAARLIGLDWGSTHLRAFLIDAEGALLETRTTSQGAATLQGDAAFARALADISGAWRAAQPGLPLLACGMVGSKHGWRERPYLACPADATAVALACRADRTGELPIVPGLMNEPLAAPDVMRGEETQIFGALQQRPELAGRSCILLPGTHAKWAQIERGSVRRFATHMTGELYALLRHQSVLARLMPGQEPPLDEAAFAAGVDAARASGGLAQQLFGVRSLGLTGGLADAAAPSYLSGLLIGSELRAGLPQCEPGTPLALVGDAVLCERYVRALARFEVPAPLLLGNTAPAGLWQIFCAMEQSA